MQKSKRGGDDLTRSSHRNIIAKRAVRISKESCIGIGDSIQIPGDLHGHSNQDVLTELSAEVKSNLSKSVASLAVRSGDTLLFACSGIAIERHAYATKFATSPNLVTVLNGAKYNNDNVKIEVRHEGSEVYEGFLAIDGVYDNFSVVKVMTFLDVNVGLVEHAEGILPYGKVVALGRGTSGELVAKRVTLAADVSRTGDKEDPVLSMAKTTKVYEGGPLFSFDGNFIGMNHFLVMERAVFLPWGVMLYQVNNLETPLENKKGFPLSESTNGVRLGGPTDKILNRYQEVYRADLENLFGDIDSMDYPKLPTTMLNDGMVLVNTFEETFGDVWGEGVSRELGKNASDISRIVVALASFKDKKMVSACTGFFIRWNGSAAILTSASLVMAGNAGYDNKIVENLRIEVLLPNNKVRKGTLEHYSLHYNVALVSVEDTRVVRTAKIQLDFSNLSRVAAAGRCFRSGTLMAASGHLVSWSGRLDCKFIKRSTCKISKAGIGGPLFNMDGEVIGMNFYSEKIGTPFLLWKTIGKILAYFKEKSDAGEVAKDSGSSFWKMDGDGRVRLNRWPVPMACWRLPDNPWWRYPDELDDDAFTDVPDIEIPPGEEFKYGYIRGKRYRQLVQYFWTPWRS